MASGVSIKLQWMAQTHEFMSNTNWTRRVIKRKKECRKLRRVGVDLEELVGGVEWKYDHNTLHSYVKFSKN